MPEVREEQARDGEETRSATERAEELVDHLSRRIGLFASLAGLRLLGVAARAREEAEDLWAEAQHIRRGER